VTDVTTSVPESKALVAPPVVAEAEAPLIEAKEATRVELEDGSKLFLDKGARARLSKRSVRLERGRGFVEVAKGSEAFSVVSDSAQAIAHGTKFAFDLAEKGLEVAVSQGTVELRNKAGAAFVGLGEAGTALPGAAPTVSASPRVSSLCEWMCGLYSKRSSPRTSAGDLIALDPVGQEIHLAVRNVQVTVHLEDGVARTTVDTTYFNDTYQRLEGTFTFLVPPGASVSRLAMYVNGELMEGGVLERQEARQVYEEIRYVRRCDPALLEWMEGNVYKMRIFPLEPRQEKRVIVSYTQELEPLYGKLRYALPLEVQGREIYQHLGIRVRVKNARTLPEASYELTPSRDGDDILLSLDEGPARPAKDLIIYTEDAQVPRAATLGAIDARYVLARWRPTLGGGARKKDPRHFAIVVDENGARTQAEVIAQNELVARLLSELDDQDKAQVLALTTRVRKMREEFSPARESSAAALAWLDGIHPLGASNLELGLAEAAKALEGKTNPHVVYVGSGIAMLGERDPSKLVERLAPGTVFVGVGVGKKTDESLLASLATKTAGTHVLVNPEEPIAWRVFDLVTALATPRLSGLNAIALDARGSVVPGEVFLSRGTVADGEEVRVLGRFSPNARPAKIAISGFQGEEVVAKAVSVEGAREGALYLPNLWARRHVETLIRDGADSHKDEIVLLGKRFFIATPFTSLIVLENEAMYQQYKVVPAPRDGWAFYETPKTIPVVTEWDVPTIMPFVDEDDVVNTIARRVYYPSRGYFINGPFAQLAATTPDINGNVVGNTVWDEMPSDFARGTGGANLLFFGPPTGGEVAQAVLSTPQAPPFPKPELGLPMKGTKAVGVLMNGDFHERASVMTVLTGDKPSEKNAFFDARRREALQEAAKIQTNLEWTERQKYNELARRAWGGRDYFYRNYDRGYYNWSGVPYICDLTLLAPGLQLRGSDATALVERTLGTRPAPGKQDPAALKLLARARRHIAERAVTVQGFTGFASGDGRLCVEHKLASGLVERIVATENDLYELYPDLGLAAHRVRSRFDDLRLEETFPFLVPTERALAGWDVVLVDPSTIALVSGDSRIELAFDAEGSLVERREYVEGNLVRQTKTADLGLTLSEPTDSASFEAITVGYVVLDMPVKRYDLIEAELVQSPGERFARRDQLRFAKLLAGQPADPASDQRLGTLVLRLAALSLTPVEAVELAKTRPTLGGYACAILDPSDEDSVAALEKYVANRKDSFFANVARLALAERLCREAYGRTTDLQQRAFAAARAFAEVSPDPELLITFARYARAWQTNGFYALEVAKLYDLVPDSSDLAFVAREEAAEVLATANLNDYALERFEAAHRLAMRRGFFPALDARYVQCASRERLTRFLEEGLDWAGNRPRSLLQVAAASGNTELASRAILALPEPLDGRRKAELGEVLASLPWNDLGAMRSLVHALLERRSLEDMLVLHDLAANLAEHDGHTAVAARELERAIELETTHDAASLATLVNLQAFRQRVSRLLNLEASIAGATVLPGEHSPALAARIEKVLEQVQRVDREDSDAYALATKALLACQEKELSFEAATTPISVHPADGAPYQQAAMGFSETGEHGLAVRLYAEAARCEPQDPQPLLQEARERELLGDRDAARSLFREIVQKTWHQRYAGTVSQAQASLGGH
jgi:hypothetical protein